MERNKTKMRKLKVTEMNRLGVEEFHVASKSLWWWCLTM